jgi:hypothetical protein
VFTEKRVTTWFAARCSIATFLSPLPSHPHQKETRAAKVGIDLSFFKLFQDETLLDIHAVPLL